MSCLRRLLSAFSRSWAAKASPSPRELATVAAVDGQLAIAHVHANCDVGRLLFKSRHLFAKTGLPKPSAFEPEFHPELKRLETSVCGLAAIAEERLWHLGRTIRAGEGLTAVAAVLLPVRTIDATQLSCEAAPELPHYPEHGVILGWHEGDEKSRRLNQQAALAATVPIDAVKRPP